MLNFDLLLRKRLTIWWANIESMISAPSSVLKDIFKSCITYIEILLRQRMHTFISVILINKTLWVLLTIITFSIRRKNIFKWIIFLWLIVWREISIISFSLLPFLDEFQKVSNPLSFINMFKLSLKLTKSYNNSNIINLILLQLLVLHLSNPKLLQTITFWEPKSSL